MTKRAWTTSAIVGLLLAASSTALAANPTFYVSRPTFMAALDPNNTDIDDFSNVGYGQGQVIVILSDANMTAVRKETIFNTTGFSNLNIVQSPGTPNATYCAGCNGSYKLTFTATTVGTANGVFGQGVDISVNDPGTPYHAYITFGDATTLDKPLPANASFFGVTAPELVKSIHYGLANGGTTMNGSFVIDNLTIGASSKPPTPCMVDADCDDKNPCNGAETCDPVKKLCIFPGPLACDDMNPCTADSCDPMTGCVHAAIGGMCDDNDKCTVNDQCMSGMCVGTAIDCNDSNDCTDDACDMMIGCVHSPNNNACDDGDMCTTNDTCSLGTCGGDPVDCDDKNTCTDDTCDPVMGCVHTPNQGACDDGDACTSNDTCNNGTCTGVGITCDDMNACTMDSCDKNAGCKHAPIMGCVPCMVNGTTVSCEDHDVCTKDSCGTGGCKHDKIDGCCHTDADCNQDEACDQTKNACVQVSTPDGSVQKAGCSCRAPGEAPSSNGAWVALGALSLAFWFRRRK